ncbi:MAG: TRAP transporter small permease [Devosia sp.]
MRLALEAAAKGVIAGSIGLMVVAALLQVISRYVFNSPLGWTEELAKFLMVWWTFLAVAMLAFKGRLLAIDALLMALPARPAHLVLALAQGASAFIIGWLTWLGVRLVELAGTQITPALDVPYAYIYAALPIGLGLATVGFAIRAASHLTRGLKTDPAHPISVLERSDT